MVWSTNNAVELGGDEVVLKQNGHKKITSLADLTSDPKNARKHTPRNVGTIVDALHEVGAARSIVIDEHGVVLAGNATMDAAIEAGLSKVQVVDGDGETVIAVRRSGLTAKQKTRLALYDNRAAELAEWDSSVLASLDPALLSPMFSDKELAELLSQTGVEPKDAEPQIDKAEELRQKWGTETGQLWIIGNHRLLVGDATNKADVERLGVDRSDLVFTDPPYSSGGFQETGKTTGSIGARGGKKIASDNLSTRGYRSLMLDALALCPSVHSLFLFCDWKMWIETFDIAERSGHRVRNMLVWDKMRMGMGMPFRNQHELILFASKISGKIGNGNTPNVLQFERDGEADHHVPKPAALVESIFKQIDFSVAYDPFVGGGTTLVAAENLNRKCYAIEISPAYVAVCLERMSTAFPHLKIEKAEKAVAA